MDSKEFLLVSLIEECAEVIKECSQISQRATKALRFGLHEVQPGQFDDNLERLRIELQDLEAVRRLMAGAGIETPFCEQELREKKAKILKYREYSVDLGCVDD